MEKLDEKVKRMETKIDKRFKANTHEEFSVELKQKGKKARVEANVTKGGTTEKEEWVFVWRYSKVRGLKRKSSTEVICYNQVRAKNGELRFFRDLGFGKRERVRLTRYRTGQVGGDIRRNDMRHKYIEPREWHLWAQVQLCLN